MDHDRGEFLRLTAGAVAATLLTGPARAGVPPDKARIKGVAFDGFLSSTRAPSPRLQRCCFPGPGGARPAPCDRP